MPVQSRMPVPAAAGEALGELASRAAGLAGGVGREPGGVLRGGARPAGPARDPAFPGLVLALCTAAVLCGCTALEDVTAWAHAAPQEVLAAAGARRNALGVRVPPHPDTIVRVLPRWARRAWPIMPGRTWPAARTRPGHVPRGRAGPGCRRSRWTARRSAARPGPTA